MDEFSNDFWETGGGYGEGAGGSYTPYYDVGPYNPPSPSMGDSFWGAGSAMNFGPMSQPGWGGLNPGGGGGMWGGMGTQGWGNIFGGLGALAGLGGVLAGGGRGASSKPNMSNAQKGGINAASAQFGKFAQGGTPAQQSQMALLQAIAGGQGLAQPYAQSVEQAFEPQMGSLYAQATNAGRARGFHDAPATSPAGGAVLGPGLADLQGQIAQAKLAMMMGLPQLFNAPINQQMAGAQGQANLFTNYPSGMQQSMPLGPQIGMGVGNALQGLGQSFGQQENQQAQRNFQQQMLQLMAQQARSAQQGPEKPFSFDGYIPQYNTANWGRGSFNDY